MCVYIYVSSYTLIDSRPLEKASFIVVAINAHAGGTRLIGMLLVRLNY